MRGLRLSEKQLEVMQKKKKTASAIKLVIGIDPGKETGYAEWCKDSRSFKMIITTDFPQTLKRVLCHDKKSVFIYVEASRTKADFDKKAKKSHTRSVNIGMVYRESHLMAETLSAFGYMVEKVHPQGKVEDPEEFKRITGHRAITSQHGRDAAMLAFQK